MANVNNDKTGTLQQTLLELTKLEQRVVENQAKTKRERSRFQFNVRVVLIGLSCLALVNIHFLHVLTQEFRVILNDMVAMYGHFGRVADRMADMAVYVEDMEQNIKMMPVITMQMEEMNMDISSMKNNMSGMSADVMSMEQRIGTINYDVVEMSQRFRNVNMNVGNMQYNVNQMSNVVP